MIIAIAGGSGSGKTTVSKIMQEKYQTRFNIKVEVVSMDDYYKNIQQDLFENYDHPDAFNVDLLHADLKSFLSTGHMQKRSYDFHTKQSTPTTEQKNVSIVILEGLYPFYEQKIRDICHMKLFLDVGEDIRIKQRLKRDLNERGISIEKNMEMINDFVNDMYNKYVLKQKGIADKFFTSTKELTSIIH